MQLSLWYLEMNPTPKYHQLSSVTRSCERKVHRCESLINGGCRALRGGRALHVRAHSLSPPSPARLLGRTQWPDTAASRSRGPERSQTAGKSGELEEPPSSAPGTPQPTFTLLTSLLLH